MKTCRACGEAKPIAEFYMNGDRRRARCKDCVRRSRGHSPQHSENHRLAQRELWIDQHGREPWDRDSVIAALQRHTKSLGRAPTIPEWEGRADWRPTSRTVKRIFGSWTGALDAAGIPGSARKHKRAQKTCRRGHSLTDPRNLYVDKRGSRVCRRCAAEKAARYRRRKAGR